MLISINGFKTYYQKIGNGPNLVLLHGWGCDWGIWNPIIPELSNYYTLIIPDMPGFGSSEANNDWNSCVYAEWLNGFLKEVIGNEGFSLLGHSFGGKVSIYYYHKFKPQTLKKLILVDISGLKEKLPETKGLLQTLIKKIPGSFKNLIPYNIKSNLVQKAGLSTDYLNANSIQKEIFKNIIDEDISSMLEKINISTYILWGKNDLDTPLHLGEKINQSIKHSKLKIFENSGHFPFIDQPKVFVNELRNIYEY